MIRITQTEKTKEEKKKFGAQLFIFCDTQLEQKVHVATNVSKRRSLLLVFSDHSRKAWQALSAAQREIF